MKSSLATIVLAPRGGQAPPQSEAERRDLFSWAAGCGFEGVEISSRWLDVESLAPARLVNLRREIEAAGLMVSGLNVERALGQWGRIHRVVGVASMLGAHIVNISLAKEFDGSGDWEPLVEAAGRMAAVAREAAKDGIQISVELHDDGLLDSAAACLQFHELAGESNLGVNPDLGNICRGPAGTQDWEGALRRLAPLANCWHVKNYRNGEPAPLDDGDIDYCTAMRIMLGAGYGGWVSIESRVGEFRATQAAGLGYLHELHRSLLEPVSNH